MNLQEIRERWSKATRGPWARNTYFPNNPTTEIIHIDELGGTRRVAKALYHFGSEDPDVMANSEAIANAPTDIAWLLAEVERMKQELEYEIKNRQGWQDRAANAEAKLYYSENDGESEVADK